MSEDIPVPEPLLPSIPDSLDGVTAEIQARITAGRRAALTIAMLIAHAREEYFPADPSGWLTWARDNFGYGRRMVFQCLKAGALLLPRDGKVHHDALLECDLMKLEMVARIPEAQRDAFLERVPVAELSRDELRAKVRLWEDPEPGDDDEADAKAKPKPKAPAPTTIEKLIDQVAGIDGAERARLKATIDPMAGTRAAFTVLDIVLEQLQEDNWLNDGQYHIILELYDEAGGVLRELSRQVTMPERDDESE